MWSIGGDGQIISEEECSDGNWGAIDGYWDS